MDFEREYTRIVLDTLLESPKIDVSIVHIVPPLRLRLVISFISTLLIILLGLLFLQRDIVICILGCRNSLYIPPDCSGSFYFVLLTLHAYKIQVVRLDSVASYGAEIRGPGEGADDAIPRINRLD